MNEITDAHIFVRPPYNVHVGYSITPAIQCARLTGSAVITHDVTTGTGYCLVGFNWIIDFLN